MARRCDLDAANFPAGSARIRLFKDQVLGVGAYGKVCRAERDHLPCAAKIIHETLSATASTPRGHEQHTVGTPLERFRQECEILRSSMHPNIIQYLGMYQDPDNGLPVLLMELMEESLTRYLEQQPRVLPYHIQVNICHDITLALVFLHAKYIIHRDLSSNNVLLSGVPNNIRAKVTDFGMARLVGMEYSRSLTLTTCPGATVYMPPEAVRDNPVYTNKIDCFSFGVLVVQILTQQFPNPGDRLIPVQVCNTGSRSQRTLMEVVPETDRRRNHISQIDPNHPLLPTARECLRDNDFERPTAHQLCERMAVLKRSPEYDDSNTQNPPRVDEQNQLRLRRGRRGQHTIQSHGERPDTCQAVSVRGQREPAVCPAVLDTPTMRLNWSGGNSASCEMYRWCDAVMGDGVVYFRKAGLNNFHSNYCYSTANRRWNRLPVCPLGHPTLTIIDGQLTAIGDKNPLSNELSTLQGRGRNQLWITVYPPMPTRRYLTTALCTEAALLVAGGVDESNRLLKTVEVMHNENRQWSTAASLPLPLTRCSVTLLDGCVYLLGGMTVNESSRRVLYCSLRHLLDSCRLQSSTSPNRGRVNVWNILANLPVYDSTCVAFSGSLLAIGGRDEQYSPTSSVYMYKPATNTWEIISHMVTPRYQCFATVLASQQIMVVGGVIQKHPRFRCTSVVEFATLRT